jgi:hypothetical protein
MGRGKARTELTTASEPDELTKFALAYGSHRKKEYELHRKQRLENGSPELFQSEFESALRSAATRQMRPMRSYLVSLKPLTDENLGELAYLVRLLDKRPPGRPKAKEHKPGNTKPNTVSADYKNFQVDFGNAIHIATLSGRTERLAECIEACIGRHTLMEGERGRLAGWFASQNKRRRGAPTNISKVPSEEPGIAKHEIFRAAEHNAALRYGQLLKAYRTERNCKQVPREDKEKALKQAQEEAYQSFGVRPEDNRVRRLVEKGDRPASMRRARKK